MKKIFYSIIFTCLLSTSYADNNRENIIHQLNKIDSSWHSAQFKSWINSGKQKTIRVGDNVVFHFLSQEKSYLTMLEVDAYGVISISFPLMSAKGESTLRPGKEYLLPNSDDSFSLDIKPPMGRNSIYLVATKYPIKRKRLGLDIEETTIPTEEAFLFINDLKYSLINNKVAMSKIEQNIIGRNDKVGYNQNDIVATFKKKPTVRSFTMRSISRTEHPSSSQAPKQPMPKQQTMVQAKLNLYINFESGSDQLTQEAKDNLDQVGLAFQRSSLSHKKFVLSGHTDIIGDNALNLSLSKRRALTAKNYLMKQYNINASRLSTLGYGESKPIESGTDRFSLAANRRVEIEEWRPGMSKPEPLTEQEEEEERDGTIIWLP